MSRHRSTGTIERVESVVTRYDTLEYGTFNYATTYGSVGKTVDMTDVSTPSFKRLSKMGHLIFNPMVKETIEDAAVPGRYYAGSHWLPGDPPRYDGYISGLFYPDRRNYGPSGGVGYITVPDGEDQIDSLVDEAVNGAYARIDSSQVDALVTFGELRETLQLLKWVVSTMANLRSLTFQFIKKLERSEKSFDRALSGALSDHWLRIRYGFRPLIAEIRGWLDAFDSRLNAHPPRQTFRFAPQISEIENFDTITGNYGYIPEVFEVWGQRSIFKATASAGVICEARLGATPDTLGLYKVPQAIWDLTTLSFVVDWIWNVSDTIAAWVPDAYWRPLGAWVTITRTYEQEAWVYDYSNPAGAWDMVLISGCKKSRTRIVQERVINPSRSILPSLRLRMDWAKYIDLVALGRSRWKFLKHA